MIFSDITYGSGYNVPDTAYFNAVLDVVDTTDDGSLTEPVTLAEAKAFARVTNTNEDAIITALITAARQAVEKYLNMFVIQRSISATLNNSLGGIFLPYGPVTGDVSLKDCDGNVITDFRLSGVTFPQVLWPQSNNIQATYTAGYDVCPVSIRTAIKQEVTFLFRNRGEEEQRSRTGSVVELGLSSMAKTILKPIKRGYS